MGVEEELNGIFGQSHPALDIAKQQLMILLCQSVTSTIVSSMIYNHLHPNWLLLIAAATGDWKIIHLKVV